MRRSFAAAQAAQKRPRSPRPGERGFAAAQAAQKLPAPTACFAATFAAAQAAQKNREQQASGGLPKRNRRGDVIEKLKVVEAVGIERERILLS